MNQLVTVSDSKGSSKIGLIAVPVIGVLILAGVSLVVRTMYAQAGSGSSASLNETYCNTAGKVCFSYPKSWQLSTANRQVTVTDPATKTTVAYAPEAVTATTVCGAQACLFTALSANISNGFSNGNDVAGVFQNTRLPVYSPEYCLISTAQLLGYGLKVDAGVDIKSMFSPTFVNEAVPGMSQLLEVVPPADVSFNSANAATAWLHSSAAQTAESIVNSARLKT